MEILTTDLHFVKTNEPMPTVEVDIDSIPEIYSGYGALISKALKSFSSSHPAVRATIYVCQLDSVNFGHPTWSLFLGVVGQKSVLNQLLTTFQSVNGVRARMSDYISTSQATREYHIENGKLWTQADSTTWYSDDEPSTAPPAPSTMLSDDATSASKVNWDDLLDEDPIADEKVANREGPVASRFRKARSDASIGRMKQTIELMLGLPTGSVLLCGPNGKGLRSDASIGTLRKRWGE